MNGLSNFPSPPVVGQVTVHERHGELVAVPFNQVDDYKLSEYPEIDVSEEALKPSVSKESAKSAFLEHSETKSKRIKRAWYEHGVTGVLEELANSPQARDPGWLCRAACSILGTLRWASSLHATIFPHYSMSSDDIAAEFSPNPQWREGLVRCLAWHPHTNKCAVVLRDDSIKVHQASRPSLVPLLKHKLQKVVTAIAWRPNSASELAVACQSCILIWTIEPTSLATRPSTSSARVFSRPGHSPVSSLDWDPSGQLLVSASATSTSMVVWDVAKGAAVALRRWGGGGVSLVKYSPEGSKLFAGCPSTFRIWECQTWNSDMWKKITSRVRTVCWSPDGTIMLFATDQPIIYSVTMRKTWEKSANEISSNSRAVEVADVTCTELKSPDGETSIVGGSIQNLAWDPTGERLAVQFEGSGQELIALYQTRCKPVLELLPCGFVRGGKGESPLLMSFQPQFRQGALLTVVWCSGRVSHVPLYFAARGDIFEAGVETLNTTAYNGHSFNASLYTSLSNES